MARLEIETITQVRGYRVYTYLEIGEIGVNSPKSPLKRGTKILIPPGGFRSLNEVQPTCGYTVGYVARIKPFHRASNICLG
jgi:hypothetical protein